jgi:dihydrofolate synthase / folylpolyglutamate synthase
VGIGGRLDATNVIPPPLVAVITNIGWDHTNLLGNTLSSIAFEKAGIFKTGTIGVTAEQGEESLAVIRRVAQERDIPLHQVCPADAPDVDSAFVIYQRDTEGNLHLRLPSGILPPLRLALRGAYQSANAATAAAVVEILRRERDIPIPEKSLITGLEKATLPGRFQLLRPEASGPTLVLDGAHNADGAQILAEALHAEFGQQKRYTFVIGTSRNHAPGPYLEVLAPLTERVIATAPAFKPTPASETARAAADLGLSVTTIQPASKAIRRSFANASAEDVVVVTGSFYVVGETPKSLLGE